MAQGKTLIPVSILVNHALADGKHIAQFYEALEKRLNGKALVRAER